uniref:hypothetical protein n=1 Tax=Paractinoplanes polyasparticus TaxID=2856853 RepID=UPI001C84C4D9|nr:hypothetical protein [Actinoplanes polyasparticus]
MRVLFDGLVPVAYSQAYVTSFEAPDMTAAFAGQVNGLCGAGVPGGLFLMTGTHSGFVRFTVELHESEPPAAGPAWEEVVEVPFRPRAATVDLVPWADSALASLSLAPDGLVLPAFRVRYCALGMDEAQYPGGPDETADGDYTETDHRPDRYLLAFWPVGAGGKLTDLDPRPPDVIVRQTSEAAAYWHGYAASTSAPAFLWEQVEAESRVQEERLRRVKERRHNDDLRSWGGRLPSDRLRALGNSVRGFALEDRDLVDAVVEAGDAAQRQIAIWAARSALTAGGIADLDWLAPAWAALDRGEPLPAEFTVTSAMLSRLADEPSVAPAARMVLTQGTGNPGELLADRSLNPWALGLPALWAAGNPDPLRAALQALEAMRAATGTYGSLYKAFRTEILRAFPALTRPEPPRPR